MDKETYIHCITELLKGIDDNALKNNLCSCDKILEP